MLLKGTLLYNMPAYYASIICWHILLITCWVARPPSCVFDRKVGVFAWFSRSLCKLCVDCLCAASWLETERATVKHWIWALPTTQVPVSYRRDKVTQNIQRPRTGTWKYCPLLYFSIAYHTLGYVQSSSCPLRWVAYCFLAGHTLDHVWP